ncbi:MAG TPA: hypothetical protein H9853_08090 [Candidatus Sphingobacterium stercoripullorum]|uniref:Photosynthetic protein synthase I n=1 Tax=Candidatus Sphingobacterium stercoripullorum TaxID=2838759 RepID=A0A9D2AYY2_9SPHI|nr:hypothetical protein [Candidatus Sphingobacterium stercoripullorum]
MANNKKKKSKLTIILLALVLLLPGFLYLTFVRVANNSYLTLPYYSTEGLTSGQVDLSSVYIPDAKFQNLGGEDIVFNSDTTIRVFHLISLGSPSYSRNITDALEKVVDRFQTFNNLKFYSINVDTLAGFADADDYILPYRDFFNKNWFYIQPSNEQAYGFIRDNLLLDVLYYSEFDTNVLPSNQIVLIDKNGFLRGIYNSDNPKVYKIIEEDIKVLLIENLRGVQST